MHAVDPSCAGKSNAHPASRSSDAGEDGASFDVRLAGIRHREQLRFGQRRVVVGRFGVCQERGERRPVSPLSSVEVDDDHVGGAHDGQANPVP